MSKKPKSPKPSQPTLVQLANPLDEPFFEVGPVPANVEQALAELDAEMAREEFGPVRPPRGAGEAAWSPVAGVDPATVFHARLRALEALLDAMPAIEVALGRLEGYPFEGQAFFLTALPCPPEDEPLGLFHHRGLMHVQGGTVRFIRKGLDYTVPLSNVKTLVSRVLTSESEPE